MLKIIESFLLPFHECFRRRKTFQWFTIIVTGLMLRTDRLGVTSVIRDLALDGKWYESMMHFFRSTAFSLKELRQKWYHIISQHAPIYRVAGRAVIAGDGVKQCKEAFHMPGVKKMAQESETCSKPEYIHGHLFGAVGLIIASSLKRYCLPLKINIQDGLRKAASWEEAEDILEISPKSHVDQMIEAGFEVARQIGKCFFLMDRYFLTRSALKLAAELNASSGCGDGNLIEIVTKAKANCTAYRHPYNRKGAKGRPRKRGSSIKLESLFRQKRLFQEGKVTIYGEEETVSYCSQKLLWGQGLYQELLFVLTECRGMKSILVCTDTSLDPLTVIELYSLRFGIESLFREFKQQVGGFSYHFWTSSHPKLKHFAKTSDPDPLENISETSKRNRILEAARAIEMFVFCSSVAMGILQIISLDENLANRITEIRYLRTCSKKVPSEGSVMYYFRRYIFLILIRSPESFITQYIREKQPPENDAGSRKSNSPAA